MLDLIIDRTGEDAAFAADNRDSPVPLKGAYNASDLNRVGRALNYLSGLLYEYGYGFHPTLREDWQTTDNFTEQDGVAYLATIKKLKESYFVFPHTPPLPADIHALFDLDGHERANHIEQLLLDIETIIGWMVRTFHYSDQYYSGEEIQIAGFSFLGEPTWEDIRDAFSTWGDVTQTFATWGAVLGSQKG